MGAEVKGVPGSFAKGVEVVEEFLDREVGVARGSYVMKNGSGLNDTNRFSSAQLTRLLRYMYDRFPLAPEYLSSMGIAGKDGTLRYRFEGTEAVGRLRAKTGTLENVSALSGYVQSVGGEKFAFSVVVNDYVGRSGPVVHGIDALGAAVAASGGSAAPSLVSLAAPSGSPSEEVKTRIRTYLALAAQRDGRNIAFLRTAWRTEKDPAVKAVVAHAIYLSNPQDYLGVRALLDSFSAQETVYGRLRQLARELKVEVPAVSSVVELAAEGNLEAVSRVVELARGAGADEQAQSDIAEALCEVARTAGEELVVAMHTAAPPDRDTATVLLAKGLVKAAEADHPFWPSVRKLRGAGDPALAAYAKSLEESLSLKIAAEKAPREAASGGGPLKTAESRP
jgi:D-alanyl-D-alanine carboxypeptidase/D-alanyl-D-alanine-endopeptidase (penicillin-binding protein 4)